MSRFSTVVILVALCILFFGITTGHADLDSGLVYLGDINDWTWVETVDTVNGPVDINTSFKVPNASILPIYEVAYRVFREEELNCIFPGAQIGIGETDILIQQGNFSSSVYPVAPDACTWPDWPLDSDYAEGVSFSKQEVADMLQDVWQTLYCKGNTSVWIRGATAHSRTWRKDREGELVEPLSEHGYYEYYFELDIDGITVYDDLHFDHDRLGDNGPSAERIVCSYYDEDNYQIIFKDIDVLNRILDDAPIMPIESIKEALRTVIITGHLREIYRIELCYLLMWTDGRSGIITVPAWVVHGEYHENASAANYEEPDNYYLHTLGGYPLIIPAQTGILLDYAYPGSNRWLASSYLKE